MLDMQAAAAPDHLRAGLADHPQAAPGTAWSALVKASQTYVRRL